MNVFLKQERLKWSSETFFFLSSPENLRDIIWSLHINYISPSPWYCRQRNVVNCFSRQYMMEVAAFGKLWNPENYY